MTNEEIKRALENIREIADRQILGNFSVESDAIASIRLIQLMIPLIVATIPDQD